jgi:hypothetical protein
VHPTCWTGSGPEFTLSWGRRLWTLSLDQSNPGLVAETGRAAIKLLSLEGIAKGGRFEPHIFGPRTLIGFERYRESVRATFAPPAWGGLVVRAAWAHAPDREQVDLEVQMSAASVGELTGVEVVIKSTFGGQGVVEAAWSIPCMPAALAGWADAGDAPLASEIPPRVWTPFATEAGLSYIEMAHPNDVARRTKLPAMPEESVASPAATRYALLGHDLEKGVVLRARVRGAWVRSELANNDAGSLYREFLSEPLPLRS